MFLSKPLLAILLGLFSALSARLAVDELRLRSIEASTKALAQLVAEQQKEAEKFNRDLDAAAKKQPRVRMSGGANW